MKIRFLLCLAVCTVAAYAQSQFPGDDAADGVTRLNPVDGLDPYTGNFGFTTRDLTVSGAVGQRGLSWARHATSRVSQASHLFGLGHNWAHTWQWEMTDAGKDGQGRDILSVREPQGWVHRFTEVSPGEWRPEPSVKDYVVSTGDSFVVKRANAGEVRFIRNRNAAGDVYRMHEWVDGQDNVWRFAWQQDVLVQVTEPAGRWLKIDYRTLASNVGGETHRVISQVTASDGQVVTYHYDYPAGVNYPVLMAVTYPDDTRASYTYHAPRSGDRLLLTQSDDPRVDANTRGRRFVYHAEADAAFGQVREIQAAGAGGVIAALAPESSQGKGAKTRSYAIKKSDGKQVYQTYNKGGNLAEEVDALGFVTKHEYSAAGQGHRIATTNALGHVTRFENDANGHLVRTLYSDGSVKSWRRDERGRVLAETDELGHTRTHTRDERGRVTKVTHPDGSTEETTYNGFGQVLTRKDRGGAVVTMTYDARGLLLRTTNALGAVTTFAYDSRDRQIATTDPHGNTTRYERDAAGRVTRTTYADGATTSAEYDEFGQLVRNVDASGAERRRVYDEFGRNVASIGALGRETRTEYAPIGESAPWGQPVRTITPSGRITSMAYDKEGRLIARTSAAGTKQAATMRTAYDAAGRQISATNPAGKTVKYFHDSRGRRIKTMSALNHATTVEYNAAGRKLSETDAKGNTTRWTYDGMGRELTKTDAKGQTTRREYNASGQLAALTDPKLNTYRFEYDLLGRQTALVYPDGSRETTAYDAAGRKLSTTNRAGVTRTFAYDNRNREIRSAWSDGSQTIVKAYDMAGRMTLQDNGVSKLTFAYDEIGRLASETQDLSPVVTDGASDPTARTVSYTYNMDGQRETLRYPDASFVKFAYDEQGRLAEILGDGIPPPIASYDYDAAGNATMMPRENATETEREFDAENKTLAVVDRVAGRRSPLSELDYLYDEVGNRTATLATQDRDGDGTAEARLDTYRYDETYQVTGADYAAPVTGIVPPGASATAGTPAATVRFTYDAVGNRLAVDESGAVTRYTVNNLNQYTQVGEFAPTHDRNGNLSGMGQWLYRYDALNRLVFASNGATTAKFWYDAKNRCVARSYTKLDPSTLASTSTFTLNTFDNWNLIEERDGTGAQQARYVHGRKIDEIIVMINRHGTFYPHHDVLGNVTMLTGRDGLLVERYDYSVTGQVTISDATGKTLAESAVGNRWMFTGREWLQEVGLYDYRNRVYSAELGRFLQTDPIRFHAGDVNIYRYVFNRHLVKSDPSGMDPNDSFATADGAANDAATWTFNNRQPESYEYGTFITYNSSSNAYSYSTPVTQNNAHYVNIGSAPSNAIATFHTHTSSNQFSEFDIERDDAQDLDGYMLAPNGDVLKNDQPNDGTWWGALLDLFGLGSLVQTITNIFE